MKNRKQKRLCIVMATIALYSTSASSVHAVAQSNTQQGYNLAFVDADVKRVVDAVLGSMLRATYDLDPDLKGNITLRTTSPVAASELIPLLERALAPLDAVIIRRGDDYRILSRQKARTLSPVTSQAVSPEFSGQQRKDLEPSVPGFASEAIALRFASASSIVELATELLGKDIISIGSAGRNEVIVSGSAEERDAAKKLIARFDIDSLAAMNFQIWELEDVDAQTLVDELDEIFSPPFDIIGTRVRLVPLPRLGSVLGIAADNADLNRIEPWIKRLDNGGSGKRKLYSYTVQNGRARDIANSLQLVLGGTSTNQDDNQSIPPLVNVQSNEGIGGALNTPSNQDSISQNTFSNGPTSTAASGNAALKIVPNDQNNSLLIYANGEEYGFIREALEKLDKPVSQVLIEATLAEVTLSDDLNLGINFQSQGNAGSAELTITNSATTGATPASVFPGSSISLVGTSANAVLNTLQTKTNVKVLSAPKLLMLNNETATLQVGDQVPIVTQQAQAVDTVGAPIVNSIELRDTGVILQVTPRVNDSGIIMLDISQEVSDVAATTTSGINSPTIQQRRLTTSVSTKSGQIIVLGGLIRDSLTRTRSGIPLLSQIPIIGGLFGNRVDRGSRTELIILITPTIIRSPDDVKDTVDALIDGLDLTRPLLDEAQASQVGARIEERRENSGE